MVASLRCAHHGCVARCVSWFRLSSSVLMAFHVACASCGEHHVRSAWVSAMTASSWSMLRSAMDGGVVIVVTSRGRLSSCSLVVWAVPGLVVCGPGWVVAVGGGPLCGGAPLV